MRSTHCPGFIRVSRRQTRVKLRELIPIRLASLSTLKFSRRFSISRCLSRVTPATRCLDHAVPLAKFGDNSWRNLVCCCQECNFTKNDLPAADFLRWLHRERRLTDVELAARFRALDALAAGNSALASLQSRGGV
jgi:hypothetical protein